TLEGRLGGSTLLPAYQMFRRARMVKSADEVARLERAAQIAEDGIAAVLSMLKAGATLRVDLEDDKALLRLDGDAPQSSSDESPFATMHLEMTLDIERLEKLLKSEGPGTRPVRPPGPPQGMRPGGNPR
ncbi:MAG TPA: hypothetical protein VKD72_25580, partial [Gemmataceae bacterium]|nr:hypothetical protein [Gemmataceae bacterium]